MTEIYPIIKKGKFYIPFFKIQVLMVIPQNFSKTMKIIICEKCQMG